MARRPKSQLTKDPLWYKDAVIYQLHVKSFFDANDDGIGDFAGLNAKLDYIDSLGVNTVWLLPFYPSPRKDDGYDIAGYREVSADYAAQPRSAASVQISSLAPRQIARMERDRPPASTTRADTRRTALRPANSAWSRVIQCPRIWPRTRANAAGVNGKARPAVEARIAEK